MPQTALQFYQEENGEVPLVDWLETLPAKVRDKCLVKLERLETLGYELRRPEADYLRDDVYELRVRFRHLNYRMLYFFYGKTAAVVSHGCTKENEVPASEIEAAVAHKQKVMTNPRRHLFRPEE
ncbi:MAG: type II toxin-antitoxin system RelE/ParE family toxin [Candidatus Latescibacteria bacterium]|nr:type II toxin-antitoxin system RelE/ParE family toxin [Candidatus Latescibacterota bacterium]